MRRAGADRRARRLLHWYPKEWRLRYGEEFTQLLTDDISDRPRSWHRTLDVTRSGLAAQIAQRQLTRSRLAAAALIFGTALAGAAILHAVVDPSQQIKCPPLTRNPQASCLIVPGHVWVNPAAIAIASLGVAVALGLLLTAFLWPFQRRLAGAAAIIGAASATVLWVATYRQSTPVDGYAGYPGAPISPSPAWGVAEAVLGIAAVGAALAVLRHRRALTRLRLATVVLVLGTALAGALIPHVVADPGGRIDCNVRFPPGMGCPLVAVRRWVEPAALALCAFAAAGAAGVLVTARRPRS